MAAAAQLAQAMAVAKVASSESDGLRGPRQPSSDGDDSDSEATPMMAPMPTATAAGPDSTATTTSSAAEHLTPAGSSIYQRPADDEAAASTPLPANIKAGLAASYAAGALVFVLAAVAFVGALAGSPTDRGSPPRAAPGSCPGGTAPSDTPSLGPVPLIFDADFASFMDDSFALAYVFGSPELELVLALASGGPGPAGRAAALGRHLDEAGRGHVPLGLGPPNPLVTYSNIP